MISNFLVVVLMVGSAIMCIGAPESGSREVSDRNRDAVLKYLRQVARSSDIAIRVYYRGACDPKAEDPIPFPFVNVHQPSKGKTGLAALREIFEKDKGVTVTEETGIIRIWIGTMPTAILRTKLSVLTLDELGQYNPDEAIIAISNSKEMETAMHSLGVIPVWSASSSRALPAKELPHLPGSMRNVTVEQILDLMAKTWDGPVIYGACAVPTDANGGDDSLSTPPKMLFPKALGKNWAYSALIELKRLP